MRQIDQKLQLLLQTWAEPCKHLLFLYKQSRDTWALSCGIYGNHTERSKQVVFFNAYMHTSPRFDSEVRFGARYRTVSLQAPV